MNKKYSFNRKVTLLKSYWVKKLDDCEHLVQLIYVYLFVFVNDAEDLAHFERIDVL